MPRHPPIALKTLDRSHCQYPSCDPEGIVISRDLEETVASAKSCAGFASMELAQKDQLLEIGSRARLGRPIICRRLSISCDKSRSLRIMKFEQIFSLRCQTEQAASQKLTTNLYTNDFCLISTRHLRAIRKDRRESRQSLRDCALAKPQRGGRKRQSCGLREWWSRTGSNRRHPACKAGALPAELRPLIPCRGNGGPGRT